jgi:C_GCAxxG_C_C family probable redox protein
MRSRTDRAAERFLSGCNCAQSVLWAWADTAGLDPEKALKIACGFGAGIARRQEICGAVAGGIMVIGLLYGRGEDHDRAATDATYARTHELIRRFEERHGTCQCRGILEGVDLATDEGRRAFRELDLLNRKCLPAVQSVVAILEEIT